MKAWIPATLAVLFAASAAHADCTYPRAPEKVPDGNSATHDEMVAAKKAFDIYNGEMNAYLTCMEGVIDGVMPKDTSKLAPDEKTKLENQQKIEVQKHDAAVDALQASVARFNEQLHVFLAKNKK
jgi:hypothetical protein